MTKPSHPSSLSYLPAYDHGQKPRADGSPHSVCIASSRQLLPDFLLGRYQDVHRHYMKYLYRRDGFFLFTDIQGQFRAQIKDVTPEGRLVLQREDGWERAYAFKEVRFDAE